jgi:hypothetical protein
MRQFGASLTYDTSIEIYNRIVFMIQATAYYLKVNVITMENVTLWIGDTCMNLMQQGLDDKETKIHRKIHSKSYKSFKL